MSNELEAKIRDYILANIFEDDFDNDSKLPSENFISKMFKTSRHKVRSVYDTLEEMGMVISKQGMGRFVKRRIPDVNIIMNGTSFSQKMKEKNIPFETKNLGVRKILGEELKKMNSDGLKGNVYEISRLRIIHNVNSVIHRSYLSEEMFPNIELEGENILSINKYYDDNNVKDFYNSDKVIKIVFPSSKEIEIFNCKSLVPLLLFEGKLRDEKTDQVIEITQTKYRGDLFNYTLT